MVIKLTRNKTAIIDPEDYSLVSMYKWHYSTRGYAVHNKYIKGSGRKHQKTKAIFMHRIINRTPDGYDTDHINQNKLDNRKSNLRTVNRATNMRNCMQKNNKSGYKGVSFERQTNKWKAQTKINGVNKHIGRYESAIEASNAYKQYVDNLPTTVVKQRNNKY